MIKVLKETPMTFHGEDCMEVLVQDDCILKCTCCDLCCYSDFEDWIDAQATCMDVHGCTPDSRNYFITKPL